jgi:phage terminase large subunit
LAASTPKPIEIAPWAEALFTPSRFKAVWGGRGGSKSRSVVQALILKAVQGPERVLCAREVQKSIKDSSKRLLDDEIARMDVGAFFESTESEIRGKNGSLFIFAGLRGNATAIKSLEGVTIAWVDEAQSISQASLDTLIPTIRAPGSEVWLTWNPLKQEDPVDAMFRGDEPPPGSMVIEVQHDDNPWFPDELRVQMEWQRTKDYDKYLHIWRGAYWRSSEAQVFKNWRVGAEVEFEGANVAEFRLGADFGYSIDPSCLVRCYLRGQTMYVDHEAYMIGCEIEQLPELFGRVPEAGKWPVTADSSRPETISYLRTHGFPRIRASVKGPGSVEEGIAFLQSYDIVVHPRCTHVADELATYSYKLDKLTGEPTPVLEDKNNHLIDALRYALEGVRRVKARPETVSVFIPSMARR